MLFKVNYKKYAEGIETLFYNSSHHFPNYLVYMCGLLHLNYLQSKPCKL